MAITHNAKTMPRLVKIYDCDKKELIKTCLSQHEASEYLGIPHQVVNYILRKKSKNKSNKLGLIITCR